MHYAIVDLPMKPEPHDFVQEKQHYGCDICGCRYHCSACNNGSGMMGHSTKDVNGSFFSCQEPERARQAVIDLFGRKINNSKNPYREKN